MEELKIAIHDNNLKQVWTVMKKIDSKELNRQDDQGNTTLHLACKLHRIDIIEYIVRFGGKMNIKNNEKKTPYDYLHEDEKIKFSAFEDCLYGQGKYKFFEKDNGPHNFMGNGRNIVLG